jgi:hypothetical protein
MRYSTGVNYWYQVRPELQHGSMAESQRTEYKYQYKSTCIIPYTGFPDSIRVVL